MKAGRVPQSWPRAEEGFFGQLFLFSDIRGTHFVRVLEQYCDKLQTESIQVRCQ